MEESPDASPRPAGLAPTDKLTERPSPLTGIARGGIAIGLAAMFLGRELLEGEDLFGGGVPLIGVIAAGFAVLAGLSGIITWRTTTFIADDDEFRVEKHHLSKTSTRVDYTKVQSVDIAQPFVARLMGLAKVHIDVGGAGGVDLEYLTKARAESLREHLLAQMQRARRLDRSVPGGLPSRVGGAEAVGSPLLPEDAPEELVVKVPPKNLLLGSLVSSGTAGTLVFASGFLVISIISGSPVTLVAGALAVVGWLWSQTGANWGFVMTRRGDTLRLRRGLFSTTTQGLRPKRIQAVAIQQDLLQRLVGLYRVNVTVLGYGNPLSDESGATNAIVLPYGTWGEVLRVLHAIWPEVDLSEIRAHGQPARARWLTPVTFATHTWGIGEQVVVAQHGLFTQTRSIVPHRRMQSAGIVQGPLQRRLGLAQVSLHTTDGPVSLRLRHLDEREARTVFEEQLVRARRARLSDD